MDSSSMMNPGVQLACAMWALTALSVTLVMLRLYTRIFIIKFVGAEDHLYAWTCLFLVCFTSFIQVAVNNGLGQDFWRLSIEESSNAIFWTYVANTFAITGNAMAKLSMGLFLLRVVQVKWHKVALWTAIFVTVTTSIVLTVMLWNQTSPIKASWDPLRTPGKWNFEIQPLSVGLGVWSSICDFFFAIFPWLIIWSLRMPQREKIMLAGGMSLGVLAGACGITRTVVLSRLDVLNYTLNFVPYFAWAGAEIAVAMVCIGVPTLRPLYLKARGISSVSETNRSNTSELPRFRVLKDHKSPDQSSMRESATSPSVNAYTREKEMMARPSTAPARPSTAPMRPATSPTANAYAKEEWLSRPSTAHIRPTREEHKYMVRPGQRVRNGMPVREDDEEWPLGKF